MGDKKEQLFSYCADLLYNVCGSKVVFILYSNMKYIKSQKQGKFPQYIKVVFLALCPSKLQHSGTEDGKLDRLDSSVPLNPSSSDITSSFLHLRSASSSPALENVEKCFFSVSCSCFASAAHRSHTPRSTFLCFYIY